MRISSSPPSSAPPSLSPPRRRRAPPSRSSPSPAARRSTTPATIRALWQTFEVLSLSSSPLTPEIDDEGGAELAAMLSRDVLLIAKPETRRLLHVALMELRGAIDAPDEPDPEEPAPAAPAYVAASAGA